MSGAAGSAANPLRGTGCWNERLRRTDARSSVAFCAPCARASSRRRAPGLLREEVALLAGISATWYTWLEQGREANPSAQVLHALADVLKLLPVEREHLFKLAKPEWLPETSRSERPSPDPWMADLLTALSPNPAYALNRAWDFAAWNDGAAALFGGFDPEDPVKRNLLTRLFLDPDWRALFAD
ncbi:MAG: helix-turn-helix domain-containing protein, partial [Mesorhizobium sp.]